MSAAAPAPGSRAEGDEFSRLISSSTLTFSGYQPTQTLAFDTASPTGINPTLVTATGSSPPPPSFGATRTDGGSLPSQTGSSNGSSKGGMSRGIQNLLIVLGCVAGFILVLLTFWLWYRARRGGRAPGGFLAFLMPKRKSDSYYRQLQSPSHGWESRATDHHSERKPSMQSRSDSISPIMGSPAPRTRPVMSPAPVRLSSTFIGRERNNLVRASLNRHQLSTLDEHSSYEYESDPVIYYTPPQRTASGASSPTTPRSLAQQISTSAHVPKTPTPIASLSEPSHRGLPIQLDSNYSVAPLQFRKVDLQTRQSTRSSWTTVTQPVTPGAPPLDDYPFPPPPEHTMPRFGSVDHWADYQNRMALQGRSMTSVEYSQAFRDRDSTADSMGGRRESTGTIAIFRYHPGEEVSMGGGGTSTVPAVPSPMREVDTHSSDPPQTPTTATSVAAASSSSPVSPVMTNNNNNNTSSPLNSEPPRPTYQPFQVPRRMHSARNPRAGPRYQSNNTTTTTTTTTSVSNAAAAAATADGPPSSDSSSSSSSPSSSIPPPPPDPYPNNDNHTTTINHHRKESEATVFNYHPGREVVIDRANKIKSEDLDALYFGPAPQRSTSHIS
ncbi:MAG: mitofusin [Watsoniomyces obsoletus]|nr:MAG: mitofusin [Watsoniomyces obsoletus]